MTMTYDPAAPEVRRNPFPVYSQLQDDDPVHWSESLRSWVLTRYDDVRQVAMSDVMSPDRLRPFYAQLKGERREILAEVMRYLSLWMVFRDPPEHTRLRRLVGTAFTPRSIEALADPVGRVVDQLLDALPRNQSVDWAQQVAMPLPAYVILDLLGIPHQSYADLKAWSDDLRAFVGSSRADPDRYNRARHGATHVAGFFREVIAARRAAPGEDFVSRMITARDEQGSLSEDELVATCMLVLFAGHETTTHLLSNSANALLDHPDQLQRLRDNPALINPAVEEFLRYDGPSNAITRVVSADHEIGGKLLRSGDRVFAMVNAANRDPRRFDNPQGLDIARQNNRHLTFGFGQAGSPAVLRRVDPALRQDRTRGRRDRMDRLAGDARAVPTACSTGMTQRG